jgi:hypothetical protein
LKAAMEKEAPMRIWMVALALASVGNAEAEWLVLRDGQRSEVQSIEVVGRSVRVVTLAGKTWALLADVVDLEATRRANVALVPQRNAETASVPRRPGPSPAPLRPSKPQPSEPPEASPPPALPPPAPATRTPRRAEPPPPRPPVVRLESPRPEPAIDHRFAFFVNGVAGTTGLELTDARRFDLFREEATLESLYRDPEPRGYEVGALVLMRPRFGVTASAELFDNPRRASFVASLPHPFFYDRAREVTGSFPNVDHVERVFHLGPVLSLSMGHRFSIDLFGGPSLFWSRSELLTDVGYDEVFPFDDVVPTGPVFEVFENQSWGYHAGASASLRIIGIFGVDLVARYSHARVRMEPGGERELTFDAGGFRLGAGIRLLIP